MFAGLRHEHFLRATCNILVNKTVIKRAAWLDIKLCWTCCEWQSAARVSKHRAVQNKILLYGSQDSLAECIAWRSKVQCHSAGRREPKREMRQRAALLLIGCTLFCAAARAFAFCQQSHFLSLQPATKHTM